MRAAAPLALGPGAAARVLALRAPGAAIPPRPEGRAPGPFAAPIRAPRPDGEARR